jgi:hypothetical protein
MPADDAEGLLLLHNEIKTFEKEEIKKSNRR